MTTAILATISTFQKVLFRENDITLIRIIKIIRFKIFLIRKTRLIAHKTKIRKALSCTSKGITL